MNKVKKASLETGIINICLAGGVSANSGLRQAFEEAGKNITGTLLSLLFNIALIMQA